MLVTGQVPAATLLARHGLAPYFAPLVAAVTTGNMRLYDEAMAAYSDWYIASGVLMLVERLQMVVYRTLFKRACVAHARRPAACPCAACCNWLSPHPQMRHCHRAQRVGEGATAVVGSRRGCGVAGRRGR